MTPSHEPVMVPQVLELAQTAALGLFGQPYAGSNATFHGLPL